ncbi:MAG: hypothetical protein QXE66_07060 [Desulfurococcaceae archaeon]
MAVHRLSCFSVSSLLAIYLSTACSSPGPTCGSVSSAVAHGSPGSLQRSRVHEVSSSPRSSRTSHGLLCIYISKHLSERIKHLYRREVVVRVTVPGT